MKLTSKSFIALAALATMLVTTTSVAAEPAERNMGKVIAKMYLAVNDLPPTILPSEVSPAPVEPPAQEVKAVAKDLVLKGDAKCTVCHDESDSPGLLAISQTRHGVTADGRTPTCTSCHGESAAHIGHKGSSKPPKPDRVFGKNTATPAAERNAACLSCHRGDKRTHWDGSQHQQNDVACSSCHTIHNAHDKVRETATQAEVCYTCHKEQRADSHKMSTHPLAAGKIGCSGCHSVHGSAGPKLLKKNTVTETCFTCHADKRGPFLFAHQPVTEDCTNCHTPHGSNITPLLKTRAPFMCQECHDGSHASGTPVGPNAAGYQGGLATTNAATTNRLYPSSNNVGNSCMDCHVKVHGSNSPAGGFLQR